MKIAFLTLGCKVNSYETEKMKEKFESAGHMVVSFHEAADVYIINTCTVTNIADRKSRQMLHRAHRLNPDSIVVATGCYVDSAKRSKEEPDESVDLFVSNTKKDDMVAQIEEFAKNRGIMDEIFETASSEHMSKQAISEEHTRAYLKVQNGCNQFCTYCIIPYVRGPLISRKVEDVMQEVKELASQGYKEVVVTGIHLSSYGVNENETVTANTFLELEGKPLLELLEKIGEVDGIERIRLGSLEPRIITENFAHRLSMNKKVCPHFHLSLQSGCDATLKRMNRHYSGEEYLEKLAILRKYFVHPAITTDIIVGFPQESEQEFNTTCQFAKDAAFAQIHVFKYSRRKGTIADGLSGQITQQVKGQRSDVLLTIEADLEQQYQSLFMDTEQVVLLEETMEVEGKTYLVGYNERYVRIGISSEEFENQNVVFNTLLSVHVLGHLTPGVLLAKRV